MKLLITLSILVQLVSRIFAQTCAFEDRSDFLSDADYAQAGSSLPPSKEIGKIAELLCDTFCTDVTEEVCEYTAKISSDASVYMQIYTPADATLQVDCAHIFELIREGCIEGRATGTPKAEGKDTVNGVFFQVKLLKTPHSDQTQLDVPVEFPVVHEDQPYTFNIVDYSLETPNSKPFYGLLAVGKEANCEAAAYDPDDKAVAVFQSHPYYDSPIWGHYGSYIRDMNTFILSGVTGKICNLEQFLWFTKDPNVEDRYVWTDGRLESQPFGHCDINLDISTTQCDAGNGVTATWRPIMECLVYGSNNYCGGFGA